MSAEESSAPETSEAGRSLADGSLALVLVAAGVLLLWFRFNAPPPRLGALFPHDLVYYFLPQMEQVGLRLAAGELPLWNPYPCAGLPLLASLQTAVFYPGTWLAAFIAPERVLSILGAFHLFVGALGAAVLFRTWGVASSLAAAFGVVFGFACLLGQTFWPPEVATIAWVPWTWACTERILRSGHAGRWWALLVGTTALELLAGFPQFAAHGMQLLGALALLRTLQRARRGEASQAFRALALVVAALVLGAGVAAVQLGPSFGLLADSGRSERPTPEEVHYLNRAPRARQIVENALSPEPRLTTFELGKDAGYLGTGTLIFMVLGLVGRRRDPLVWCLAAGAGGFVMLSDGYLGAGRDVFQLYALLPGVGEFRAPERLLFPAFACAIGLAALGATSCERAREERIALAVAAAAVGVVIAIAGTPGAAWRAAIAVGWVIGALWLPLSRQLSSGWKLLLAALLIADVGAATGAFGSLRGLPDELGEQMRAGRAAMLSDEDLAKLRDRASLSRVEFVAPGQRVRPVTGAGRARGLYRLACYEPFTPSGWTALSERVPRSDYRSTVMSNVAPELVPVIYDAASVGEIVRGVASPEEGANGRARRFEPNPDALPRAYLVERFEVMPVEAALDALATGSYDVQRGVMLGADPGIPSRPASGVEPARIVSYEPERVEVAVESARAALLVLTDTHVRGWSARVSGEPAPIYRANGLFRAVVVPPGANRVVFAYMPTSLLWGSAISLASALVGCAVLLRARVLQRRR